LNWRLRAGEVVVASLLHTSLAPLMEEERCDLSPVD
jgi:hypothetical protein